MSITVSYLSRQNVDVRKEKEKLPGLAAAIAKRMYHQNIGYGCRMYCGQED